jgi:hypothetical protein
MSKIDHLRLCNEHGIPFQDFEAQFCQRCLQPECTRSQHGKSRFEERVASWQDRLFLNVPRMPTTDERFRGITAQKFLTVDPGTPRTQAVWADPKDLEPPRTISIPTPPPEPVPEPAPEPPPPSPPPPAPQPSPEVPQQILNTPVRSRQMIGGVESKPTVPVLDPWQPKQPLKPGEHLVEPGARIRFGKK